LTYLRNQSSLTSTLSPASAPTAASKYVLLPPGFSAHYIDWIMNHKDETLPDYAVRLGASIDSTQPFVLIGLSLGGIMAAEIAKRLSPAATIIRLGFSVFRTAPLFPSGPEASFAHFVPARPFQMHRFSQTYLYPGKLDRQKGSV
jgi:surfactin synthase thioesterase subunit